MVTAMDVEERRRRADANAVAAFTLAQARLGDPRGETARFGAVEAVAIGVDVAFFNPVLALDPASTPDDVLAAIAWVEAKGLPVSVQIRSDWIRLCPRPSRQTGSRPARGRHP
jgi:hypothetical protein